MKITTAWRRLGAIGAALALALAICAAILGAGPALSQSADCERLRQAIADASNSSGASQYQAAAERQGAELERMSAYARSIGCDNRRFLIFGSEPPAQCPQITAQIQRMRSNLDDLRARAGGGSGGRGELIARYNAQCVGGGGGRNANGDSNNGGLLGALFGQPRDNNPDDVTVQPLTPDGQLANPGEARAGSQAVCVRACDGSFFPVSYSASSGRLGDLDGMCHALCPNADVSVYTFPSGGEIEQAVSAQGQRYLDSPNALKYRQSVDASCTCRRRGQSWAEALAGAEARLGPENKGDIIVTPQKAIELSRPKAPDVKPDPKAKNAKTKSTAAPTPTIVPGTDVNGVDTTLSAAAAAISRDSSGILGGADIGSAPVSKDKGSTEVETGPDGSKRKVRIIDPAL